MQPHVLIVSHADDLHGLVVQDAIRRRGGRCDLVECNQLSDSEAINLAIGDKSQAAGHLRSSDGTLIDVSEVKAVWWRRYRAEQLTSREPPNETQQSLVNNDCTGALAGVLRTCFKGVWISTPEATERASNKPVQLATAKECGFRIPDTLISQVPHAIQDFFNRHCGEVIIKPVVGAPGPLLFTQFLNRSHFENPESIRACPAIYQEFIPGNRHIRLNCFGARSYAGLIESENLDWRPDLNVPVSRWDVPDDLHNRVRAVLDALGLEMGIVDLKLTPEGEAVWLEVNPQGQFLFVEGITGLKLSEAFSEYLLEVCERHNSDEDGYQLPRSSKGRRSVETAMATS